MSDGLSERVLNSPSAVRRNYLRTGLRVPRPVLKPSIFVSLNGSSLLICISLPVFVRTLDAPIGYRLR